MSKVSINVFLDRLLGNKGIKNVDTLEIFHVVSTFYANEIWQNFCFESKNCSE